MAKRQFQWKDPSTPVFLHFQHEKFWEISLNDSFNIAQVRVGKLKPGDIEADAQIHVVQDTSMENLQNMINSKLDKGYEVLKKDNDTKMQYSITVTQAAEENPQDPQNKRLKGKNSSDSSESQSTKEPGSHKRKTQDNLIHDDQKKVKTNELAESEKDQNQFIMNKISSSKSNGENKQKKPENIMIVEEPEQLTVTEQKSKPNSPKENGKKFMIEDVSVPEINDFKGDYLINTIANRVHFCKVQVLSRFVKVESGVVDNPRITDVQVLTYKDSESAEAMAKRLIFDKTLLGYKPTPDKFQYTFKCSEVGLKEIPIVIKVIGTKSPRTRSPRSKSPAKTNSNKMVEELPEETKEAKEEKEADDSTALKGKAAPRGTKKSKNQLSVHHKDFDALSDSNLSPTFEFDDIEEVSQRKEGKKSRSQAKSVSPERRPQSRNLRKYALGEPVKGCYQALLDPYNYEYNSEEQQDIKGWYMSENLDGVRCFWDGKEMWLRKGKKINTPEFFVKGFPASPLDGVLWAGRSQYQKCVTAVGRKKPDEHEWNTMTFKVFDVPEITETFDKRLKRMEMAFTNIEGPYIGLIKQYECKGKEHLKEELDKIVKEGGSGIMLRDPKSLYEKKRSKTLLEVKPEATEEATVIKHEPSKTKNDGKIGGLRVKNEDGIEFSITIGVTEAVKKSPPKVGDKILYKHRGLSETKVPKYPAFVRVCNE